MSLCGEVFGGKLYTYVNRVIFLGENHHHTYYNQKATQIAIFYLQVTR